MNTNNYNKSAVINAFVNGAPIIDNHDNSAITDDVLLIELVGKEKELSLVMKSARYQCLNAVYLKNDGTLHLSMMSIAGTVERLEFDKYNESCTFESFKIKRAITRNGSEIVVIKSEEMYKEEKVQMNGLDMLKAQLEELLLEEKDSRILDIQRHANIIKSNVKSTSKSFKIAHMIWLICGRSEVKFDDISDIIKRSVNTMTQDLLNNDILVSPHSPLVSDSLDQMMFILS